MKNEPIFKSFVINITEPNQAKWALNTSMNRENPDQHSRLCSLTRALALAILIPQYRCNPMYLDSLTPSHSCPNTESEYFASHRPV